MALLFEWFASTIFTLTYLSNNLLWMYIWYIPGNAKEADTERAKIFKSNKSQVRLPKPVALPESVKQVDIVALGRARLITPAGEAWDSWFEGEGVTEDFMVDREQLADPERDSL